ncbi:PREDICTED: uncharacterized protein LOC107350926 [Acropora digitifera]|uniref:uncharacterized protein LOC107350926 n=1 Tax=Acropora digitifera TaxID=70779 RepID=UPI00077A6EA6|nr:PREDICTED: uncharacterized protein LOC107350926 [Acropora digitifera]
MFCTVCRESKKKNPMASSGTNNFRRSTLERHSESQDHQSAVEAKLLRRTMRTTTEKAVTKAENAIIAAMRTAYFTTKLNIPISHYGEMIEFLKFRAHSSKQPVITYLSSPTRLALPSSEPT